MRPDVHAGAGEKQICRCHAQYRNKQTQQTP